MTLADPDALAITLGLIRARMALSESTLRNMARRIEEDRVALDKILAALAEVPRG